MNLQTYILIKEITSEVLTMLFEGGPGSGNWGHKGRPGKRGGSLPSQTTRLKGSGIAARFSGIEGAIKRVASRYGFEANFSIKAIDEWEPPRIFYTVDFLDKSKKEGRRDVGFFTFNFDPEIGYLENFSIRGEYQGKGFGGDVIEGVLKVAKKAGVKSILLDAEGNGSIGSYAWAAMGWNIEDDYQRKEICDKFKGYLSRIGVDTEKVNIKNVWDIASFAHNGEKVGKKFLIEDIRIWRGVFDLKENSMSWKIFNNYMKNRKVSK